MFTNSNYFLNSMFDLNIEKLCINMIIADEEIIETLENLFLNNLKIVDIDLCFDKEAPIIRILNSLKNNYMIRHLKLSHSKNKISQKVIQIAESFTKSRLLCTFITSHPKFYQSSKILKITP
jgi:hypothetical protein